MLGASLGNMPQAVANSNGTATSSLNATSTGLAGLNIGATDTLRCLFSSKSASAATLGGITAPLINNVTSVLTDADMALAGVAAQERAKDSTVERSSATSVLATAIHQLAGGTQSWNNFCLRSEDCIGKCFPGDEFSVSSHMHNVRSFFQQINDRTTSLIPIVQCIMFGDEATQHAEGLLCLRLPHEVDFMDMLGIIEDVPPDTVTALGGSASLLKAVYDTSSVLLHFITSLKSIIMTQLQHFSHELITEQQI